MKVREVIRMIERDGWRLVDTKGSHRQFKHAVKPGRVTVSGGLSDDLAPGTSSILKQAQVEENKVMRYAIVIEKANGNYSAYVPDLPGCVATGRTKAIVRRRIGEAIEMHVAGMREDGLRVPKPTSVAEYVDTAA